MAPSQALADETDSQSDLQKVVKPCSGIAECVLEDVEICIFRIPRGLFDASDLLNCEIKLGKKSSKVNIKGKNFEITSKPVQDGTPVLPWLPDSKGALRPVNPELSVITDVCVRRCIESENLPAASEDDLEYLKPMRHIPPDLPSRDFFSGNNHVFDKPEVPKNTKSVKKSPNTSAAKGRKNRLSLEEITPQVEQKRPSKKRKGDPLAASFKNVFDDICKSPDQSAVRDQGVPSPKKHGKKLKDRVTDAKIKIEPELSSVVVELDQSTLRSEAVTNPEREKKNKKRKSEIPETDDSMSIHSSLSSKAPKVKKRRE